MLSCLLKLNLALSLLIGSAFANQITTQAEVESLLDTIEYNYGPLGFKQDHFKWDWAKYKNHFGTKLMNSQSTDEFYNNVSEMLGALKDSHVSVSLPSDYTKSLPLEFTYLSGKTFVSFIGQRAAKDCPLSVGDYLVSFNGMTANEYREELSKYLSTGNKKSDARYLTLNFSSYKESRGVPRSLVEGESAKIVFNNGSKTYDCNLKWDVSGLPLISKKLSKEDILRLAQKDTQSNKNLYPVKLHTNWQKVAQTLKSSEAIAKMQDKLVTLQADGINTSFSRIMADEKYKGIKTQLGASEPFFKLPSNFQPLPAKIGIKQIVQSSGLFAGTFQYRGKNIGFLRIPSYTPSELTLSLFALRYVFGTLEKTTDFLIIDQTNNPGGYVAYSDWIIASLVKPNAANHMKFQVKPTQAFMRNYASLMASISEELKKSNPDEEKKAIYNKYYPLVENELKKVQGAFEAGSFLSQPISLSVTSYFLEEYLSYTVKTEGYNGLPIGKLMNNLAGMDLTQRQSYTKPVAMLINELDFSGGDATPANLQDYKRVTLYGVGTAGAGGSVGSFQNLVLNHFSYRLTNSLMIRPRNDKYKYVENVGVLPNKAFGIEYSDYKDGFSNYFARFLDTVF